MSKKQDVSRNKNETTPVQDGERRDFLKAASFAAAGFVITPLVVACGAEEPAKKAPPAGGGGAPKKPAAKPPAGSNAGATPANRPVLVNTPDEVGDRGTVKFSATTKKPAETKYLTVDDKATNAAEAKAVNGGKGPVDDSLVVVAGKDGTNAVADVLFTIEIGAGVKALKHTGDAAGVNWDFRFTRMMHVGQGKTVTYKIGDPVNHNINIKNPKGTDIGDQKNGQSDASGPTKHTFASATAFAIPGAYEVACSMHNWEKGYLWVSNHAYVGVTGNPHDNHGEGHNHVQGNLDGTVTIKDVPVGKHKVKVVREGREVHSFEIEVKKGEETVAPAYEVA